MAAGGSKSRTLVRRAIREQPAGDACVQQLLTLIDLAYSRKAWHGPNLRGSIRGLDLGTASFRPAPGRRSIWEIVAHCAYWKYAAKRRLLGEKRGLFPLKGSNWFPRGKKDGEDLWRSDVRLLEQMHRELREAIARFLPHQLEVTPVGCKVSNLNLILGIASHDLYHAGQIQLLKRLARQAQR